MEENNVIDIRTREPVAIPAAEESDYVRQWQDLVGDTMQSMMGMMEAETEEEFRAHMADVRRLMDGWPS